MSDRTIILESNLESSLPAADPAIRMESITKRFPGVLANRDVSLIVARGTFHAVIGENGAGKSTLLNVLYGRYRPDSGRIVVLGEDVSNALNSPADAIQRGLGLVSQHYALIPALTVLENIILGAEPVRAAGIIDRRAASDRILELTGRLGLEDLDLNARADRVSIATGQKIEIVKALYRGASILLLDEPTSTLAPQEADSLFALLQTLLANGTTILFVTHKLREVMAYSRNVTVLRAGCNAGDFVTSQTSPAELLSHMIGTRGITADAAVTSLGKFQKESSASGRPSNASAQTVGNPTRPPNRNPIAASGASEASIHSNGDAPASVSASPAPALLGVDNLTVKNRKGSVAVRNAFLEIMPGEIVGVAGVDGSGQRELAEAIVGLRAAETGAIEWRLPSGSPVPLNRASVRERQRMGIAYIPEDRHRTALALDFSVAENYLLGHETQPDWGGGLLLNSRRMLDRANTMIRRYDVRMGERDGRAAARALSGGNQQKVVIARALDGAPRLLVACQPTRGLDIEAARFVYQTLKRAKERGLGIVLFSLDLDEIMEMSDRIVVMFNGQIAGVVPRSEATPEGIGALMTGAAAERSPVTEGLVA